jgi:hypothetical protein
VPAVLDCSGWVSVVRYWTGRLTRRGVTPPATALRNGPGHSSSAFPALTISSSSVSARALQIGEETSPGARAVQTSEVRDRILSDHAHIRELLDGIDVLVESFETSARITDGEELRNRGLVLYAALAEHLTREDELLVPILRVKGPDGLAQARQLGREHKVQRELLEFLTDRLSANDLPTVLVARQLKNFTEYLRFDMLHEEKAVLPD